MLVGAVTVVKGIKVCLERFRVQTIYAILGMMIGSFYAIVMGPTTLETPPPADAAAGKLSCDCLSGGRCAGTGDAVGKGKAEWLISLPL